MNYQYFPINGNNGITNDSTYKKEIMSGINDIYELTEGISPINLE